MLPITRGTFLLKSAKNRSERMYTEIVGNKIAISSIYDQRKIKQRQAIV